MEKIKKPLFVTEEFLRKCVNVVTLEYSQDLSFHFKILIECFIVRESSAEPDYFTKNSRWYNFGEFKRGEVKLEGGISSDFYIRSAIESYVNGVTKRQLPKILFSGDFQEEVSIVDNESYGIAIIGCCSGFNQSAFFENLRDIIIRKLRNLERQFPFESLKSYFSDYREWQRYIEERRLSQFKELPIPLVEIERKRKDLLLAQIKTGLLNNDFEFSDEEKNIVSKFIEEQEKF